MGMCNVNVRKIIFWMLHALWAVSFLRRGRLLWDDRGRQHRRWI